MPEHGSDYGRTAARGHSRPGRDTRPSGITVDIHSHVMVPEAAALTRPFTDPSRAPLAEFATDETRVLNRKQDADRRPNLLDMDVRLADMDEAGIDFQIVMPPPPQCTYGVPLNVGLQAARIINDSLATFVARRPDRFAALGTVPMQDGEAAAAELERGMREGGLKGVQILTSINGREVADPAHDPFWAKAEALGAVVMLHPNGFTEARRMSRNYFNNVIGNPLETSLALHHLIFDGMMERHPGLKVVAAHGGGYLPAYSGRMDHAWGARPDARGALPSPPPTCLKRVYFDSVVFTPHQLRNLVELFGAGQVAMGTDYPYDMAESDPLGHLASAGLDEASRAAVAGGTAKALFGL